MHPVKPRIPPVVVTLVVALLMGWISRWAPALALALPGTPVVMVGLIAAGLLIATLGVVSFRRAGTSLHPLRPGAASTLVTSGIYRWTRNPMYLGLLLCLSGWAVHLSNALPFLLLPVFVLYLNRFQILPEERALESLFGGEFTAYRSRVRRWI